MWRALTEEDLVAFLSQKEVDAYRKSADFSEDVIAEILAAAGNFVRGHVRSSGVRLATEAASIPDSLVSPALDYAVFNVLKRFRLATGDDRRKARDEAIEVFKRVAEGRLSVEPGVVEDGDDPLPAVSPAHGFTPPPHLLD